MASTAAAAPAAGSADDKSHKTRPEKPDEDKYKEELGTAEKEHSAAQEKLVMILRLQAPEMTYHFPLTHPGCSLKV